MASNNQSENEKKEPVNFQTLHALAGRIKDGTFGEIIDDWRWIFSYSFKYKGAIFFYTVLGIVSTSLGLVSSIASKYLIDIITGYKREQLAVMIAVMIGSSIFNLTFSSVIKRISARLSIFINNDIQADIYDKIMDSDWLSMSVYSNGDIMNSFK